MQNNKKKSVKKQIGEKHICMNPAREILDWTVDSSFFHYT